MARPEVTIVASDTFPGVFIETETGACYTAYVDASSDLVYQKSTDGGQTWGSAVAVRTGTVVDWRFWYDGWSGITATHYIHFVSTDSGTDDTYYRYLDTDSDTLGTERTVYAGSSTASGGDLSITRARGGNLICATCIDAGAEYDTVKSTDYFATKSSISEVWEGASGDYVLLLPGWGADNQDIQAIFYDSSATELSVKYYDDSGNSWSETSISTASATILGRRAIVDTSRSTNVVTFWTAHDTAGADLLAYSINETAGVVALTNVVTDSTDDQVGQTIVIDKATGNYIAFYRGSTDGAEDATYAVRIYYKISTDGGTTWGAETLLVGSRWGTGGAFTINQYRYFRIYMTESNTATTVKYNIHIPAPPQPRANFQLGM